MSDMGAHFGISQQRPAKADEVSCDICVENKLKALKSCLVCLASFCDAHLEPHQRVTGLKQHGLIDPVKNPEDLRTCREHGRPLELFCKTDGTCVCQLCAESDHESHQIVSLEEECEGKKAELGKAEAEVQRMIRERQEKICEVKRSVELSKTDADTEIADTFTKVLPALMGRIEKHKTTEKQAEDVNKELKQEIAELQKRSSELKHLLDTRDHLHLLQNLRSISTPPPTKDWTKVIVYQSSDAGTVWTAVDHPTSFLLQEKERPLRSIQQHEVDVSLDPDTASPYLILSEDGKQVSCGGIKKNYLPDNPERFSRYYHVLGKQGFSSGRFYYEVQVKDKTDWVLGVARESINRKALTTLDPNNGYWTICLNNEKTYGAYANPDVVLPVREKLQKVGVFVDYEEGLVSFYDVENGAHLYSFTGCTFTEIIYPFFSPCRNTIGNSAPLIISPVNSNFNFNFNFVVTSPDYRCRKLADISFRTSSHHS